MNFAAQLSKMIDAGLGREVSPPETNVAIGYHTEYTDIANAAVASFQTSIEAPLKALTVDIEPIQEGTGDPSPENVRPISGRSEVCVTRAGKNLLPNASANATTVGITFERRTDGGVRAYGTATSNAFFTLCNEYVLPSGSYRLTGGKNEAMQVSVRNESTTGTTIATSGSTLAPTFVISEPKKVGAIIRIASGTTLDEVFYPMVCFDSLDNTFAPYDGQTITVPLGQTVYGGSYEVVSGTLTNNRASITLTDASQLSGFIQSAHGAYAIIASNGKAANASVEVICDRAVGVSFNNRTAVDYVNKLRCYVDSNGAVTIRANADSQASSASELFALFENAQIVYELATPVTVQLTAQQLTTLLGMNNVWSDSGNVSLTYGEIVYTEGY